MSVQFCFILTCENESRPSAEEQFMSNHTDSGINKGVTIVPFHAFTVWASPTQFPSVSVSVAFLRCIGRLASINTAIHRTDDLLAFAVWCPLPLFPHYLMTASWKQQETRWSQDRHCSTQSEHPHGSAKPVPGTQGRSSCLLIVTNLPGSWIWETSNEGLWRAGA